MKYPNIDILQTGLRLKHCIKQSGYTVRQIQEHLHLSCPQPIYRWFKGQTLPSIDHFYALSKLLHIPMDELIVEQKQEPSWHFVINTIETVNQRFLMYYNMLREAA